MISKSDIRYTLRMLAKTPGFTLLSILVLAGGLGVSILAFTFNYTMFYKPIPLENGDKIFHICAGPESYSCRYMKAFEFSEIRDEITAIENIGIYHQTRIVVEVEDVPVSLEATSTEWNMFQLSETSPILGRGLLPGDQLPGAEPVIVFGYGFWQQHLNGEPDAIDSIVDINGEPTRIVGIMPEGYQFPWRTPAWLPVRADVVSPAVNGTVPVETYGLLRSGYSVADANAEIATLMQRIRSQYPAEESEGVQLCRGASLDCDTGHISTFPLAEFTSVVTFLMITLASVLTGFIFLLAAISVGTLLLARTNERLRDTSVRVALGAPRIRLLLQMMGESVAIAIAGAVLGILLAGTIMELVNILFDSVDEQGMAFWQVFKVDISTLIGALTMVVITVVLTSVIPSWRIINGDFNAAMRDGTRGARGLTPGRFNRGLVVVSITIITLLLFLVATAGTYVFMARDTFLSLNTDGLMVTQPLLDADRYDVDQAHDFYRSLHDNLLQNPAVDSVYIASFLGNTGIVSEGTSMTPGVELAQVITYSSAGNLGDAGVSLLEGRMLDVFENPDGTPTIVVSRSLAQQFWPGESALGQRVRVNSNLTQDSNPWREVVGVVSDSVTPAELVSTNNNAAYLPLTQTGIRVANVQVRARDTSQPEIFSALISRAVLDLAPELRSVRVVDVQQQRDSLSSALVLGVNISGAAAAFAFLVAIAGIFGLTQNFILASTQEIGTRRALGASDNLIRRTFLRRGGKQAVIGLVISLIVILPMAWVGIATVGMELVSVTFVPILGALTFLYGAILLAIYHPLRKILHLEPSEALRYE